MYEKRPCSTSYSKNEIQILDMKIILLGDPGVGKTNIINQFLYQKFDEKSNPTLGSSFGEKQIQRDKFIYNLKIWDTTGEEKYRSITKLFIKGSNIVLLVYSIDNLESFNNLNIWYDNLKDQLDERDYVLAIVGNKRDLILSEVVSDEDGKKYAKEKGAIFSLVSAKLDVQGIFKLFDNLLDEYINRFGPYIKDNSITIIDNDSNNNNNRKACC